MGILQKIFGKLSMHQSGNAVAGDLAGSGVWINGVGQREAIQPEGPVVVQVRSVQAFDRLLIAGPFDVHFQVSDQRQVEIRAAENVAALVKQSVVQGKLALSLDENVSTTELIGIRISGPGIIKLDMVGNAEFRSDPLIGKSLAVRTVGSGHALLCGKMDRLKLIHQGSGVIDASGMASLQVETRLTGSGKIRAQAVDSVDASLTGSGHIAIAGTTATVRRQVTGSGRIDVENPLH